jgi:hypothetical protein
VYFGSTLVLVLVELGYCGMLIVGAVRWHKIGTKFRHFEKVYFCKITLAFEQSTPIFRSLQLPEVGLRSLMFLGGTK